MNQLTMDLAQTVLAIWGLAFLFILVLFWFQD